MEQPHVEPDMMTRVRKGRSFREPSHGQYVLGDVRPRRQPPGPRIFVPDMQEHAHVFVFNATDDPVEERIKAGEFGAIKRDGEYYAAVFYSVFGQETGRSGLSASTSAAARNGNSKACSSR